MIRRIWINELTEVKQAVSEGSKFKKFLLPLLAVIFLIFSLIAVQTESEFLPSHSGRNVNYKTLNHSGNAVILDTVYTDKNIWLELRLDEQMVYVHKRDGSIKAYPVSTGDSTLDRSISSRPGLFAIFSKSLVHYSSEYDNILMDHYMPFNMGIGFHGTDPLYYEFIGVLPSSHGCIRMTEADATELYNQTNIGTLVLAHSGESARTIGFAPKGFDNISNYSRDDVMKLLAHNLKTLYEGTYETDPPVRFVIDPKFITPVGFNVGNRNDISSKYYPKVYKLYTPVSEKLGNTTFVQKNITELPKELSVVFTGSQDSRVGPAINVNKKDIDELVINKRGILPVFPPEVKKKLEPAKSKNIIKDKDNITEIEN